MKIEIDKRQDGVLAACINIGKYQFRFGVYQWPWVKIQPGCYMSTVGAIVDFGILPWLFYGKIGNTATHKYGYFRVACVGIGVGQQVRTNE